MLDPRLSVIDERLSGIKRIIAVSSGKGGVGKSLIAAASALILSRKGFTAGLLDLDFTNPSSHVILGARSAYPLEDKGVVPPKVSGIDYVSIIFFTGDRPSPLRGPDVTNAFIEILALTRWSGLDYLILDTPPGLGDIILDLLKLIKRLNFLIVTTPSKLSLETAKKLASLLKSVKAPIIGAVENMMMSGFLSIRKEIEEMNIRFLGSIPFDPKVEAALGDSEKLLKTEFARSLSAALDLI
ncbi:MAG: P-loop NTPase [Thaumarchaeota archaeon]|nr:P-loop NTPase [Nitrososphaerota archaeon]